MKAVLAKKDDSNHNDVVKEFGVACCKFNFLFNNSTIPQNNQSYQISQILPYIKILSRQTRSKVSFQRSQPNSGFLHYSGWSNRHSVLKRISILVKLQPFFWLPSIKPTTYFESFFIYLNNVSICKVFLVHNLLTTKQSDFLKSFLTSQFLLKLDPRRV